MTNPKDKSQEGPYGYRGKAGAYYIDGPSVRENDNHLLPDLYRFGKQWEATRAVQIANAAYAAGQEARWIPVAMIHNDYDASVACSNCGTDGGFGEYDDLEWARFCPGCGRPISEQVSAKGIRTPHPLYIHLANQPLTRP